MSVFTPIIIVILLIVASISNAVMDISSEDRFKSDWWNKTTVSKNKWKNGDRKQGERFWLSSTVLVWATDGWHLAQLVFHTSWQLCIALAFQVNWWQTILVFIIVKTLFSGVFELIYNRLKEVL